MPFWLFGFEARGRFDEEHGTSSYLTGKQDVIPHEGAAIFPSLSMLWGEYPETSSFPYNSIPRDSDFSERHVFRRSGRGPMFSRIWTLLDQLECVIRLFL
jgi:hypothetical protein